MRLFLVTLLLPLGGCMQSAAPDQPVPDTARYPDDYLLAMEEVPPPMSLVATTENGKPTPNPYHFSPDEILATWNGPERLRPVATSQETLDAPDVADISSDVTITLRKWPSPDLRQEYEEHARQERGDRWACGSESAGLSSGQVSWKTLRHGAVLVSVGSTYGDTPDPHLERVVDRLFEKVPALERVC